MKKFLCGMLFLLFSLHAAPALADMTSGTTATGSIIAGGTSTQYFSGTSGQAVDLYAYASYAVVINIYEPNGSHWGGATNRLSFTLPATGTYTVVLSGYHPTDSGSYSLAYVRGSAGVSNGSLTSGTSYNGTLTTNGLESFQFTGTAGQGINLYVDASFTAVIVVYTPDGASWFGANNRVSNTIPTTGTYTVVVYGYNYSDSGSYRLDYVIGAGGVSHGSLTSGTSYNGTLATNGLESFQFTGTAGQGINLYVSASFTAVIVVYTPNGASWYGNNNRVSNTIPTTGTYTVVVHGYNYSDSGSYRLDYVIGGGGVAHGSLTSGTSYNGTLATNGLESFQITGTTGQGININVSSSYTVIINLYKPDGSFWTGTGTSYNGRFSNSLPVSGTYTVVVYGYNTTDSGPYRLDYVIGAGGVSDGTLTSGTSYNGTLATNGLVSFKFEGLAGQEIYLYIGASYTGIINLYKPDGSYWTGTGTSYNSRFANALPVDGTYTVVIDGRYNTDSGAYRLDFVRGAGDVSDGSLVNGKQRPGNLLTNGIVSYTFSGGSGNSLTMTSTGSFTRELSLIKPDGTYVATYTNSVTGSLPAATGNYMLLVTGAANTDSGAFTVTVTTAQPSTASDPQKIQCCESVAGAPSTGNTKGTGLVSSSPPNAASPGNAPGAPGGAPVWPSVGPSSTGNTTLTSHTNVHGPVAFAGNPINFDAGFKEQDATDYQAGGLTFSRIYRSDSTWTNNTIGALWRTNYARTLTVTSSTASITDGTGAVTTYTLTGGNWVPDDPSTMATFQTVTGGYTYTLPNGNVEKYNSSYQLTRIEYQGGGALNLTYNGSGQLTGIANENGRSLSLTYNTGGQVATLVTPDGTFSYSYDTNGNLTTVTKPDTNTIQYEYENASYVNALTGITDEKGVRYATFGYDSSGKVNSTQHAGGVDSYTVTYNADGSSTVTNPLGKSFTYYYMNIQGVRRIVEIDGAASTNTPASSEYFNYDSLGRMIGMTDWGGNTTRYQYDSRGNPTQITEATGTSLQRITTTTWNSTWNLPSLITEPGKTTAYVYDSYGRVTSATVTDTNTSEARTTTYSYYSNTTDPSGNTILGRLETIDGPRTDVTDTTTYAYDTNFDLTTTTNALSQVTTVTARDSAGRPTKITDPNSVETDFSYDSNGRVQSIIRAYGTSLAATTSFTYDADGQLTKITLPNSATVQYTWDNAQRLTGIQDTIGNTVTYTLDNAGNRTQTQMDDTTPSLTYTHTQTFDELSRILTSVGASSQTADYAWDTDSNLTTYTDPNTNATGYTYDALLRLSTATDALSGVTTLGYDSLNNVTSVKDQRNNATTYTYNAFGDVTGETSPDRGTLSYTVDKAGNVTKRIDARNVETDYTYDAINRLASVSYPSDTSLNVSLTYDSSSGCGTPYIGHLCSVTDAAGTTAYQYDDLGRMTQQKDTRGSLNFTTSYSYDLAGNITGLTLPSGRTVTNTLNSNGQVSGVSATVNGTNTTLGSSITYLPFGPLNALTYGNSLTLSASFDHDYGPTNRTISGGIASWTYTVDNNGNITQAGPTTYGYDALNRVNAESTSISYTYDATSNRLTKVNGGTTTTTVPSTSNKISAVGGNSYAYDAAGNITGDGVNTYTWNAEGELKEVDVSGTPVGTYTYNLYRQRAKKVATSTIYYVYGAGGLLYGEYDTSGNFIREYVYLNGAPLAQIDAGSPEVLTYLHTDHLGTPRFGTNASGSQVWSWTNDAFGTSAPTGTETVNLRMPGQYYDSESGLFYNWNRYYNPAIGRYISSDPIGIAGGLNTFDYVAQNPLGYVDPSGLWQVSISLGFGPGGTLTFGHNGGQWSVGLYVGVGQGFAGNYDPNDSGCASDSFGVRAEGSLGFKNAIVATSYVGREFPSYDPKVTGELSVGFGDTPYSWTPIIIENGKLVPAPSLKPTVGFGEATVIGGGLTTHFGSCGCTM